MWSSCARNDVGVVHGVRIRTGGSQRTGISTQVPDDDNLQPAILSIAYFPSNVTSAALIPIAKFMSEGRAHAI